MNKAIFLFSLTCLICNNVFGQKIFREGYIVKNNGELLDGLIEYKSTQDIPAACIFKRFEIAVEITYKPGEIREFGYISGNRYVSLKMDNKDSFFEVMVSGKITVYRKGSGYFLEKGVSGLVSLDKSPIEYPTDNGVQTFDGISTFLKYFTEGKVSSIKEKIDPEKDLIPVVKEYNAASGSPFSVYIREFSKEQVINQSFREGSGRNRIGFTAGINIYYFKLFRKTEYYLPSPVPETSPIFGLTYERIISRKNDKLSFRADMFYLKQSFYSYSESETSTYLYRDDAFFDFTGFRIPVILQYSFLTGRFTPYINAGASYTAFIETNYLHIREKENSYNEIYTTEDNNKSLYPGEISGFCGTGIKLRIFGITRLNIEARIEIGNGLFKKYNEINTFTQLSLQPTILFGISF